MGYPPPYDSYIQVKKAATLFQTFISTYYPLIITVCEGITMIDRELYSEEFRHNLISRIQTNGRAELIEWLQSPDTTRTHVYRFFLKGSNVIPFLTMYLREKYASEEISLTADLFPKDWDTTILINPSLTVTEFGLIYESLIYKLQGLLVSLSNTISTSTQGYSFNCSVSCTRGMERLHTDPEFEGLRKYGIRFISSDPKPRFIKLRNEARPQNNRAYAEQFGPVGEGTFVSSDRNGAGLDKFYLGRIFAHFIASKNIIIPVEILDVSIQNQNEDLRYAWDSHSEYHIQYNQINMRVLSPTGMYADLVKCIRNANRSTNQTRKNKIPQRIARIQMILDTMIIPYGARNTIIQANLERHTQSRTSVGKVFRRLTKTLRNPVANRNLSTLYNYDSNAENSNTEHTE
jgi:hypothetical protein